MHDSGFMPHEIVNNNSPLWINVVGKIVNFCPHVKGLIVAEVRLSLG